MFNRKHLNTSNKKALAGSFFIFIICKVCVFVAPLIFSNHLELSTYGLFEYSLTLAGNLAMVLGVGISASYPYYILKEDKTHLFPSFLVHFVFITILAVISWVLILLNLKLGPAFYLSSTLMLIVSALSFISIIYKTHEKPIEAVIFDSLLYMFLALLCFAPYVFSFRIDDCLSPALNLLLFFICLYFLAKNWGSFHISKETLTGYVQIVKFGAPAIMTSFLIVLLTTFGRILIERFLTKEDIGIYSFYFRLGSAVILFHQFVNVVYFKKIFTSAKDKLDKYFYLFFAGLALVNILAFLLTPAILSGYFKLLQNYGHFRTLHWMLSMQTILWIAVAMNESLIFRENQFRKLNLVLVFLLLSSFGSISLLSRIYPIDILHVTLIHAATIFLGLEAQYVLLSKKGIHFIKSRFVNYLVFASILVGFIINQS